MTLYETSIAPNIGKIGLASPSSASYASGGYSSDSAKASDDGTHMPEYPSTVSLEPGGYSEGYAQPKKEQDTAPKKEDDDFYIPSFDDNGTPHWKEPERQPLDVKALLGNQTPPSTFYVDDEGNISNTKDTKDNVYYGENALNKSIYSKPKAQRTTTENQYRSGDDYIFDDSYFANAQLDTGDNKVASSMVGGGSSGGKDQSVDNHNDGYFGGQSNSATPGYTLW